MDVGITRLNVPGTFNFREVAPGVLKPGVLYRSDALHRLTRVGRSTLREFGIRQVIDLRSGFDRRIGGRDRLRGTGVYYLSVPMDGAPPNVDPKTVTLREVYEVVLARHQNDFGRVLRTIAAADGATLVHCTAGKDRTGLVAALALTAIGIDRDVILADYAATAANLSGEWTERMLRKIRRFRVPVTDQLVEVLAGSPPTLLSGVLEWIDSEFGSVLGYLDEAGVDAGVREQLKRALLPAA
ncbi:tyrosine-protein phosphatase [Microbacterium sp. A82]|uniref:tyrosine-protein phosphatase n=1 Tax=Microbacterium sp. A82 TaxID=3450452 RepID=UPI003F2D6A1E